MSDPRYYLAGEQIWVSFVALNLFEIDPLDALALIAQGVPKKLI